MTFNKLPSFNSSEQEVSPELFNEIQVEVKEAIVDDSFVDDMADNLGYRMITEVAVRKIVPTVKTDKYHWGTMKTIHHGIDFSIPLHPEHHQAISKLKRGESHSFRDETKTEWTATRNGNNIHFKERRYGNETTVPRSTLTEDTLNEKYDDTLDPDMIGFKHTAAEIQMGAKHKKEQERAAKAASVTRKVTRSAAKDYSGETGEDEAKNKEFNVGAGLKHSAPSWLAPKAIIPPAGDKKEFGVTTKQKAPDQEKLATHHQALVDRINRAPKKAREALMSRLPDHLHHLIKESDELEERAQTEFQASNDLKSGSEPEEKKYSLKNTISGHIVRSFKSMADAVKHHVGMPGHLKQQHRVVFAEDTELALEDNNWFSYKYSVIKEGQEIESGIATLDQLLEGARGDMTDTMRKQRGFISASAFFKMNRDQQKKHLTSVAGKSESDADEMVNSISYAASKKGKK